MASGRVPTTVRIFCIDETVVIRIMAVGATDYQPDNEPAIRLQEHAKRLLGGLSIISQMAARLSSNRQVALT